MVETCLSDSIVCLYVAVDLIDMIMSALLCSHGILTLKQNRFPTILADFSNTQISGSQFTCDI